ncbi:hypothetical protein HPP92_002479 [Vanilla planifolia]|uniref:ABC transporter C family member 10 n=1 Tax=Vanilla planifolia TaxID=51239 RepID=A0A835SDU9_VANPL|nr:hypothetical protein HPP92_002479 [Vanilla planifolia]
MLLWMLTELENSHSGFIKHGQPASNFVLLLLILYNAVGIATIAAMAVIILTVACNAPLAKLQHKFQTRLMEAQDDRLKALTEALVNMKVLKLYAWENKFKKVIEGLRDVECKWLKAFQLRRAYNSFLFWSSPVLVSAATFSACYFLEIPLNATNVFTFVATLRMVQDPVRQIPDVIGVVIQAKVAFNRIISFLDAPELQRTRRCCMDPKKPIVIKSASFSWDEHALKPILRNINLEISAGEKVAICGEVGSGKSTLLEAVLGEIPKMDGTLHVFGKIAYVSQNAWIQTGTVRDNVLFGSIMDEHKYQETLKRCSLVKDIEMFPFGDLTEIGERGVNLSGGQKQRIQLARALYQDADIYLLDDPFSAVDAHTATSLFNEYIMGALFSKTVLLVTHQVDFLPVFNCILLMSDGQILSAAPFHELLSSNKEFRDLEINNVGRDKQPITEIASEVDQLIKKEERETGNTGLKPYLLYLSQNKGFLYASISALSHAIFIAGQVSQNSWMAAKIQDPEVSLMKLIGVYLAIGFGTIFFLLSRCISLVVSSDLSIVDLDVPFALMFSFSATLNSYSNLAVLSAVTWQVLFVAVPLLYLTLRLQRYYLASAKELMRINGTTKSLVANHLAESISGAMTIRAFEEEERFICKSFVLIDKNASPFFHNFAASEWLIQRLETMSAAILFSSALVMAMVPAGTFSPEVIENNRTPPSWPSIGRVELVNLQIKYRPDSPLVLRGISCIFEGGHKIGIVGRTGSGKTTLIGALFRLVEPEGGKIVIDGIDITKIGLHDLRSCLGIIPQEPTLFHGSVRYNLDPLGAYTDQQIWEVLDKCQLREAVQEKGDRLDSLVVEDGSNWSMGQRQLFCLGRALLKKPCTEFADCTVITVAHRIPTVMDCTMVLSISDGKLIEYDEPLKLMNREGSLFRELVKEYCCEPKLQKTQLELDVILLCAEAGLPTVPSHRFIKTQQVPINASQSSNLSSQSWLQ